MPLVERPARVRCDWELPPSAEPDAAPGPAGSGWAWATDAEGRRLILDGRGEDGMFVATALRAASDDDDRNVATMGATAAAVTELCTATIAGLEEGEAAQLVRVRAAREGEDVEVPIVYANDPARPRPISRVVIFGDSLSDDGNLKRRLKVFPESPYWLGRFSDGPNWADHFETRTGVSVQNLAYGGAVATKHNNVPYEQVVTKVSQGGQFFVSGSLEREVRDYIERDVTTGSLKSPEEAVFVIWGGANDYLVKEPLRSDVRTMLDTPKGEAGYRRIANEAVGSMADQVRQLYAVGARQFVVVNLPNLGMTPMVIHNTSYHAREEGASVSGDDDARRIELARKLGELSLHHNRKLNRALSRLRGELSDAKIVHVNSAEALGLMLDRRSPSAAGGPFDYGFDLSASEATLRDGQRQLRIQDGCFAGGYLGSKEPSDVCDGAGTTVFWDTVHPSSLTHCWIAYFIQDAFAEAGWADAPSLQAHREYCLEPRGEASAAP